MARGMIFFQISECPHCGYVARDLKKAPPNPELLSSDDYVNASRLKFKSKLALKFFKRSVLDREHPMDCFPDLRDAAWACDDADDTENASRMRKLAVEYIDKILEEKPYEKKNERKDAGDGEEGTGDPEMLASYLTVVKFDFMRRAGLFSKFEADYAKLLKNPLKMRGDASEHDEIIRYRMSVIEFLHKHALEKNDDRLVCFLPKRPRKKRRAKRS